MNKKMCDEISVAYTMGDLLYYNRVIVNCVQLAINETQLIKKIRDYLRELPEDVQKQYDFRYVRGHVNNPDKFIPYRFIMRRKLNELVYNQFKREINKYIEDTRAVLRFNLNMDVYTMFVKCHRRRDKIVAVANKLITRSKRKLAKVRSNSDE